MIHVQRVYDEPEKAKGKCFLVDRLWPRGVKKEGLKLEAWVKEAAPSNELRKWYEHDPEKWKEFQQRYTAELNANPEAWQPILDAAKKGAVTLFFSSKELELNNAVALKAYLERRLK